MGDKGSIVQILSDSSFGKKEACLNHNDTLQTLI